MRTEAHRTATVSLVSTVGEGEPLKTLIAIVVAFLVAVAPVAAQEQVGRYTIVINPINAADVYLLDTAQGKVWQRVQYGDGVYVWQYMWRLDDLAATQSFLQSVLPNLKKGAGTPTTT